MVVPRQSVTVGVDPGLRVAGAAVAVGDELVAATHVSVPAEAVGGDARVLAAATMAEAVVAWVVPALQGATAGCRAGTCFDLAVVPEWPIILKPSHQRTGKEDLDPNVLLPLAGVDVGVAVLLRARFAGSPLVTVRLVDRRPFEWKGQAPEKITCARVLERLTPAERERLATLPRGGHSLDMLSACGIVLHHLGRFEPRRAWA